GSTAVARRRGRRAVINQTEAETKAEAAGKRHAPAVRRLPSLVLGKKAAFKSADGPPECGRIWQRIGWWRGPWSGWRPGPGVMRLKSPRGFASPGLPPRPAHGRPITGI